MNFKKNPYENLYIYHVKGKVTENEEKSLGADFLGNWMEDDFSFLFFSNVSRDIISSLLKTRSDLELMDDYHFTWEEWQGEGFTTVKIEDFIISPPWEKRDSEPGEINIILDPVVVFGTGLHPTTRDCLKAINFIRKEYHFRKFLDIGTGTGILSIAAARLGAEEVLALDLNPLSVKTAKNNVNLNGLKETIKVVEGRAEDFIAENADLVVANIQYDVVKTLIEDKQFLRKKYFVFSGLMRSQVRDIKDRIRRDNLNIIKEWDYEMTWHTFVARRDSDEKRK